MFFCTISKTDAAGIAKLDTENVPRRIPEIH